MGDRVDPATDRTVPATAQYPGMTQIVRDGRSFQVSGVGPAIEQMLELHAKAVMLGEALPDYGRRWPVVEEISA
ncbi:hypothetical protein [Rhizorhabdus histidinilytica]|uniref:hypothetical protein n=1 Tax=Rhizorhabdus histidinilytica TaxID=439228 RepID=UPI00321F7524